MKMIKTRINYLTVAVASVIGLGSTIAQAEDFDATAELQNTLAITVVNDLDLGTLFATTTGAALSEGVGALVISAADGLATAPTTNGEVTLTSLSGSAAASGTIDVLQDLTLILPDTNTITEAQFDGTGLASDTMSVGGAIELTNDAAAAGNPSLWLMHFTVASATTGTTTTTETGDPANGGRYSVDVTAAGEYSFTVGATVTTAPYDGTAQQSYEAGTYGGTFSVIAEY